MPPTPDPEQLGPGAVWLVLIVGLVMALSQVLPKILGPWGDFMAKRSAARQAAQDAEAERRRGDHTDDLSDLIAKVDRLESSNADMFAENSRLRDAIREHREWDVLVLRALSQHDVTGIPDPPNLYL